MEFEFVKLIEMALATGNIGIILAALAVGIIFLYKTIQKQEELLDSVCGKINTLSEDSKLFFNEEKERLEEISNILDNANEKLDLLDSGQQELQIKMNSLETNMEELSQAITELEKNTGKLEKRVDRIEDVLLVGAIPSNKQIN